MENEIKINDLKIGEIYYCIYEDSDEYIFLYENSKSSKVVSINSSYSSYSTEIAFTISSFDGNGNKIRNTTQQEKDWLNACIEANKFIPLKDIEEDFKFEVGKWYKINDCWYAKFLKIHGSGKYWRFSERININLEYSTIADNLKSDIRSLKVKPLIYLSEIQQYLPDGHEDKIDPYRYSDLMYGKYGFNEWMWIYSGKNGGLGYIASFDIKAGRPSSEDGIMNSPKLLRKATPQDIQGLTDLGYEVKDNKFVLIKKHALEWKVGAYVEYLGTKLSDNKWEEYFGKFGVIAGDVGIINSIYGGNVFTKDQFRPNTNGELLKQDLKLITRKEYEAKLRKKDDKPFEFNRWYRSGNGLFFIESENTGYGFSKSGIDNWFVRHESMGSWNLDGLSLAEDSYVEERLLKYAKEKYPIGTKVDMTKYPNACFDLSGVVKHHKYYERGANSVICGSNGHIYKAGKWAEIIEETSELSNQIKTESLLPNPVESIVVKEKLLSISKSNRRKSVKIN